MKPLSFRFREEVFKPYLEFLRAQYRFHPYFVHARHTWEEGLTEAMLVNGPFLEKAQTYAWGEPLESLPLTAGTREAIAKRLRGNDLFLHQTEALRLILSGKNAVIATGTSSGKTLCYQIPIIGACCMVRFLG